LPRDIVSEDEGQNMPEQLLPYVPSYGNITRVLGKIKEAQTPDRFTQDYLGTTLGMTGGSATPVIPYLKRTGFLGSDGAPTDLYKRFRNREQSGAAAAEALRKGYARLYEVNEKAHTLGDSALRGAIIQVTGLEGGSSTLRAIVGSFNALKAAADFSQNGASAGMSDDQADIENIDGDDVGERELAGVNLSYTINLHLPPTSDIAVFNAIFKSLREHLLRT
jgi:hypothetical protein